MATKKQLIQTSEEYSGPIVRYDHVSKTFKSEEAEVEAVRDLSFDVQHGDFVMLIGSSGGGKTTTLKMANGLIEPSSGTVYITGRDISVLDPVALRRQIGYAIQGSVLFPHLDVEKNIAYVPHISGWDKSTTDEAVEYALNLVGLDESLLKKLPHELSGGQQQRVGIARALVTHPKMMLMDEPFGAVDEITRRSLQEEFETIYRQEQMTVMFVTHDIGEAMRLGTKLLVIDDGVMQQYDTPDEIMAHPATEYVERLISEYR